VKLCAFLFFAGTIGSDICFGQLLKREYLTARTQWERDGLPMWWTWQPPGTPQAKWVSRTALALVVVFAIMDTAGQHRDQVARMAPNPCHCRCRILGRHDSSWRYSSLLKLTHYLLAEVG
jgi:hypothetical protein